MKKVTIGLVLFGTKYLKETLPTLIDQDYENVEFVFRDQEEGKWSASKLIEQDLPEIYKKAKIIQGKNLWHSGGHNAIINKMKGEYYFCCSNDMLYPRDFVSKIIKKMEEKPRFSFATCKIKRWDYKNKLKTNFIDSLGIGIKERHHFYDIGHGEDDKGQYDEMIEVFGVSGALSIFTKKALRSIKYKDEYFDALMHYKDDVDLSYRLRWAGNKALLIHDVTVFHDRQVDEKKRKPLWVKKSSFLGEKILMKKNFSDQFPFKIKLKTKIYHFFKTAFLLKRNPRLFTEIKKLRKHKNEIEQKRLALGKNVPPKEIVKLMT